MLATKYQCDYLYFHGHCNTEGGNGFPVSGGHRNLPLGYNVQFFVPPIIPLKFFPENADSKSSRNRSSKFTVYVKDEYYYNNFKIVLIL